MKHKTRIVIGFLLAAGFFIMLFSNKNGFLVTKEPVSPHPKNFVVQPKALPIESRAPALVGISGWINSGPLGGADLRGKVALVDFWTYSCINCIRTLPHVNEWYQKYKNNGFVVLGVHSPEFDFEKQKENVETAVKKYGITYPVALDSNHATWNAFGNQYWPAHYLIDAAGNIRYHHFGEGQYAETETAIQQLLREANLLTLDTLTEIHEPPADADFGNIGTPEIYLGYARINNAGNIDQGTKPDEPYPFSEPQSSDLAHSRFYFAGIWTIGPEFSELRKENGKLILRYKADTVHMVAESKDRKKIPIEIFLDGKPRGTITIASPQLYTIIDAPGNKAWHTLEIRIPRLGFRAFTFTFG